MSKTEPTDQTLPEEAAVEPPELEPDEYTEEEKAYIADQDDVDLITDEEPDKEATPVEGEAPEVAPEVPAVEVPAEEEGEPEPTIQDIQKELRRQQRKNDRMAKRFERLRQPQPQTQPQAPQVPAPPPPPVSIPPEAIRYNDQGQVEIDPAVLQQMAAQQGQQAPAADEQAFLQAQQQQQQALQQQLADIREAIVDENEAYEPVLDQLNEASAWLLSVAGREAIEEGRQFANPQTAEKEFLQYMKDSGLADEFADEFPFALEDVIKTNFNWRKSSLRRFAKKYSGGNEGDAPATNGAVSTPDSRKAARLTALSKPRSIAAKGASADTINATITIEQLAGMEEEELAALFARNKAAKQLWDAFMSERG